MPSKYFYVRDTPIQPGVAITRGFLWAADAIRGTDTPIHFRASSVEDMVRQILANLSLGDRIGYLKISGRGRAGYQSLGRDALNDSTGACSLQVQREAHRLLGPAQNHMARLRGRFSETGEITLGGQHVGADSALPAPPPTAAPSRRPRVRQRADGPLLVQVLANLVQAPVNAFTNNDVVVDASDSGTRYGDERAIPRDYEYEDLVERTQEVWRQERMDQARQETLERRALRR